MSVPQSVSDSLFLFFLRHMFCICCKRINFIILSDLILLSEKKNEFFEIFMNIEVLLLKIENASFF